VGGNPEQKEKGTGNSSICLMGICVSNVWAKDEKKIFVMEV
jgi:hypothetical protein